MRRALFILSLAAACSNGLREDASAQAVAEVPAATDADVSSGVAAEDAAGGLSADAGQLRLDAIIAVGAPGTDEYGEAFAAAGAAWRQAFEAAGLRVCTIGNTAGIDVDDEATESDAPPETSPDVSSEARAEQVGSESDKTQLLERLSGWTEAAEGRRWVVLIGHGTANRQAANFNLVGPDVSDAEVRDALAGAGPAVVICSFSSSGGWVPTLAAPERVVVAATKGPEEYNYSRFGEFFATAIGNTDYDLDHDQEVSLFEAFLAASRETERFYADEGRIASEQAILDDNGDGVGTAADFYEGLEAVKEAAEGKEIDGPRARAISLVPAASQPTLSPEQLARRDSLEAELRKLRGEKSSMPEDDYYAELEEVFRQLAEVYASDAGPTAASAAPPAVAHEPPGTSVPATLPASDEAAADASQSSPDSDAAPTD